MGTTKIAQILKNDFEDAKERNPAISLRSYAKKIGLTHSALSQIIKGERKVGLKVARRICNQLLLAPAIEKEIMDEILLGIPAESDRLQLEKDQFDSIAIREDFALLSLMETKSFKSNTEWIAKKLKTKTAEIEASLDRLTRLKLIKKESNQYQLIYNTGVETSDGIINRAIKKAHIKSLEAAKDSLLNDPLDLRDFTSMSMNFNPQNLPKAKKLIREFRDHLTELMENENNTEVYQLNINLIPITETHGEKHEN